MLKRRVRRVSGDFNYVPENTEGIVVNDFLYPLVQVKWDSGVMSRFRDNSCFVLVNTLIQL